MDDVSRYAHSPAHLAVARRDHAALRRLVAGLPRLPRAGEVTTEQESIAGEAVADAVSAVIDRRDVPRRETPLHLAVRLRDPVAAAARSTDFAAAGSASPRCGSLKPPWAARSPVGGEDDGAARIGRASCRERVCLGV